MAGVKVKVSCTELFKKFHILPLASKFLFSLLSFIADTVQTLSELRINTRYKHDLNPLSTNLTSAPNDSYPERHSYTLIRPILMLCPCMCLCLQSCLISLDFQNFTRKCYAKQNNCTLSTALWWCRVNKIHIKWDSFTKY